MAAVAALHSAAQTEIEQKMSFEIKKRLAVEAASCFRELSAATQALVGTKFTSRLQYLARELCYVNALAKVHEMSQSQSATLSANGMPLNPAWKVPPLLFVQGASVPPSDPDAIFASDDAAYTRQDVSEIIAVEAAALAVSASDLPKPAKGATFGLRILTLAKAGDFSFVPVLTADFESEAMLSAHAITRAREGVMHTKIKLTAERPCWACGGGFACTHGFLDGTVERGLHAACKTTLTCLRTLYDMTAQLLDPNRAMTLEKICKTIKVAKSKLRRCRQQRELGAYT
jgi:hypothetical protein